MIKWFIIVGIVIVLLLVFLTFLFVWFFNKGADSRRTSDWFRNQEDNEQEKAMSELLLKKNEKRK